MIIESVELKDFRNYETLSLKFDRGINLFCGPNAAGKTNILEALYVGCTSKSHKSVKDRELVRFGCQESHIKLNLVKKDIPHRIDMHIKKNRSKGIALDGFPIRRASELFGAANVVFFSPEDLGIIKNGPSERRRFLDVELCQLYSLYTHDLVSYNRTMLQKNRFLREYGFRGGDDSMLEVYNEQLVKYGTGLMKIRRQFLEDLGPVILEIHKKITSGKEELLLIYENDVSEEEFASVLESRKEAELSQQICLAGPHRDDIRFQVNGIDIRRYGSQGQQRTAALSLKLAELRLVEMIAGDKPVLMLDDVLSELDRSRQNALLDSIKNIQTMLSCTGLDDFVNRNISIDKIFYVNDGKAETDG